MAHPSLTPTASWRGASFRPTAGPHCLFSAAATSLTSVPPTPRGLKSCSGARCPGSGGGAVASHFGTSASRPASRICIASRQMHPARHMSTNGLSTVVTSNACPSLKTRRSIALETVSTPALFCLLSRLTASRRSSISIRALSPPKVFICSAISSDVPSFHSTTPVFQSCFGRSAWVGMASAFGGRGGNFVRTKSRTWSAVARACAGSPLTSASYFTRAIFMAWATFCHRMSSVSVLVVMGFASTDRAGRGW